MDLLYVVLLILFGVLFLVAEIVLLPGVSVGALLALVSYGGAVYLAFRAFGTVGGIIAIAVVLLLSLVATIISLRAKTWQRFSLRQQIDSSSMPRPEEELHVGEGRIYEAKSLDAYVDPQREVVVVGFENFSVIVKVVK